MVELPKKSEAFFEWFSEVLERAQVTDKRYPVKGLNVWPFFGLKARSLMDRTIRDAVEKVGYEEVSFPTLIPETELQKEAEHIKGFESQVYWVTHGGTTPLDIRLCLRPTSETAMYPMFAIWVRSHKDLPLRTYQVCSVFRYETKTTRPLIRVREIHFFEGHTVHVDEEAATSQVRDDLHTFEEIAKALALPYLVDRRPDWDKFPGAHYSLALDTPFGEGRTLQVGTVHHYRDNFSRPYGIQYETEAGSQAYGHQTTYGLSERLLGAVIGVHGDDKGLVLPPAIAPVQVVVVPVLGKEGKEEVARAAQDLGEQLCKAGWRTRVDLSEDRPGAKYYAWESRGVPLRVEMGQRELKAGNATLADRLGTKRSVPLSDVLTEVPRALEAFRSALSERAFERFRAEIRPAKRLEELKEGAAVHLIGWCGKEACGHRVEEAVDGGLLGRIEQSSPPGILPAEVAPCIVCGEKALGWAGAARPL